MDNSDDKSRKLLNDMIDGSPFLKTLWRNTKPIVDAMTNEQLTRFLSTVMAAGNPNKAK